MNLFKFYKNNMHIIPVFFINHFVLLNFDPPEIEFLIFIISAIILSHSYQKKKIKKKHHKTSN